MKIYLSFITICFFFVSYIQAQKMPNEFIVLLQPSTKIEDFLHHTIQAKSPLKLKKTLSIYSNIFLLESADNIINDTIILDFLKADKAILMAQYNHTLSLRNTIPNDDYFSNQWQFLNTANAEADLDAAQAWDITTGGITALGDTIVVAIIDNGVDTNHLDLKPNLWTNKNEIPNNNLDDDGNGIIDDYYGFNAIEYSGNIQGGNGHGTSIAGIIGAIGNNNDGVVGVNWNVKLMIIKTNFSTTEADIILAYDYALQQRKLYNNSNGQNGAFVVATNSSWGLDYGQAINAPIWCAFYDTLGKYGILNAVATANLNLNVDIRGDLPSTCASEYLIAVTNINRANNLSNYAAYGQENIDLAAFGDGVFTTRQNNTYGIFGGTSSAAPHVAGAIALCYAAMCENDILLAKFKPNLLALNLRQSILQGVQNNRFLQQITASSGQLNLYGALTQTLQNCYQVTSCEAPFNIELLERGYGSLLLTWNHFENVDSIAIKFKKYESSNWTNTITSSDTFFIDNLDTCTLYDFAFFSYCNGIISTDSIALSFSTSACCIAPQNIIVNNLSAHNNVLLKWDAIDIASYYQLQYRKQNTQVWFSINNIVDTSYILQNLESCAIYEYRIRTQCSTTNQYSTYSNIKLLRTYNCTDCASLNYCIQSANFATNFYIEKFVLSNNASYENIANTTYFFDTNFIANLTLGTGYNLSLTQGQIQYSYVRVFIDYNQDGDFYDAQELLTTSILSNQKTGMLSFRVPATAKYGNTRMRIIIKEGTAANLCENFANGQVLDFCVFISPELPIDEVIKAEKDKYFEAIIQPQYIALTYKKNEPLKSEIFVYNSLGQVIYKEDKYWQGDEQKIINLSPFPKNIYFLVIKTEHQIFNYTF